VVAAQQLLREGHLVKAVATAVGYRHVTHFSRHFARGVGLSPKRYQTEFRRRWPDLR
jgi:transcriptional regulator GlxA family with amidase domain